MPPTALQPPEVSTRQLAELALRGHPYAGFLPKVEKPGRYLGGEEQSIIKTDEGIACTFVLAFPDIYEVGMSHLGTRILYGLINQQKDLVCERAFSPWSDMEALLREHTSPLVSLETYRPLREFDVVGVSLQYELSFSNVLLNLDLGGISLQSKDRAEDEPIVLAGGPTCTHPEPLAPFVDAFLVGEAEEVLPDLLRRIGRMRKEAATREEILAAIARTPGFYVPAFYEVEIEPVNGLRVVSGRTARGIELEVPEIVGRVFVRNLDDFPFPTTFPVPYSQAIFDRASVEITRGCTEGCRFCQAGMIYRPVRERRPADIIKTVLEGTDAAGFSEASLTALSTADVSCIDPLIKELVPELVKRKVSLGISSLRAYGLNEELLDEIQKVGIDGLTFAPEAGTQRMRNVINKNVSDEDILSSARRIFSRGYERMKMYFIMGLPTETEEDLMGIVETARQVRRVARQARSGQESKITISVSQHVPKPHTPFQWAAMDPMEDLHSKLSLLRDATRREGLALKTHNIRESWLECLFARGDRKMGEVLLHAYRNGARFDGWKEAFRFEVWIDALEVCGVDPTIYTRTLPLDTRMPWSHIDVGLEPGFLESEYRKALAGRLSPPCGKPAGAQVHHTKLDGPDGALAEKRRLVCYDCGVACDLTDMKRQRIDGLSELEQAKSLRELHEETRVEPEIEAPKAGFVALDRLVSRLAVSKLKDNHMHKANAEAPYSRLRLFFAKTGTMAYLGHLDLVRLFPRMMRRAGIELGFTRGFNPLPRMTFGPALALGIAAASEVVECEIVLPRSAEDMLDELKFEERAAMCEPLLDALRQHAPPGLIIASGRLLHPQERKACELITGARYEVELLASQRAQAQERLQQFAQADHWEVTRERKKGKKRRAGEAAAQQVVDLKQLVVDIKLSEAGILGFSVVQPAEGASARPRDIIWQLVGEFVQENHMLRRCLLVSAKDDAGLTDLASLAPVFRSTPPSIAPQDGEFASV